ncbi:winged helix-turn-helix domain-containing protein [Dactylosporangium sp. McL0621]|uniref:winged helix-turn-helix domain-containing protein n=1 Tax=Dactylosporangium sp. McL0621 TaxID=3415678 RepID=UPI003CF47544
MTELDPVIHVQARLRIMAALSSLGDGDRMTFPRLQQVLDMTAGNLSVHLTKLEQAGYVEVVKSFRGRTPTTSAGLTNRGRVAFDDYTAALRALIDPPKTTEEP